MLRLLRNKLFMCNFFSSIFMVFAFMGFGTFMPKYMEYQFRMKGSSSSRFSGSVGTLSKAIGLLLSGFVVSKFKPSARFLAGYNVVLGFFYFVVLIIFSLLGCPTSTVYGTWNSEGNIDIRDLFQYVEKKTWSFLTLTCVLWSANLSYVAS